MDKIKRFFTVAIFFLFLFHPAIALSSNLRNIFQAELGFNGTYFQVSSDGGRVYFNDKGSIYSIDIKDPKQGRKLICKVRYPKTNASLIKFCVSSDEKNIAYKEEIWTKTGDIERHLVILEIASGKQRIYEPCESIGWSNLVSKRLYFSYLKSIEPRKCNGAIDMLTVDGSERHNVIDKNNWITICQILPEDDIVYKDDQEFRLYEQKTHNERLLFVNNKTKGKGTGGFAETNFKLSPDKQWAVVSFDFNPWEGIWLVRLKDAKACKVFRATAGIGVDIENFGFQLDWANKQLYVALARYRHGIYLTEDWTILPAKEYPTQIYLLNLEEAMECFEKNKNLEDFSDCFNVP